MAYNEPRIRVADEDIIMDGDTYYEMLRKRDSVEYSWERRISKFKISDINQDLFNEYLRKAREAIIWPEAY